MPMSVSWIFPKKKKTKKKKQTNMKIHRKELANSQEKKFSD